jgi:hypothetical protein
MRFHAKTDARRINICFHIPSPRNVASFDVTDLSTSCLHGIRAVHQSSNKTAPINAVDCFHHRLTISTTSIQATIMSWNEQIQSGLYFIQHRSTKNYIGIESTSDGSAVVSMTDNGQYDQSMYTVRLVHVQACLAD